MSLAPVLGVGFLFVLVVVLVVVLVLDIRRCSA